MEFVQSFGDPEPGAVMHASSSSTWETEAGGLTWEKQKQAGGYDNQMMHLPIYPTKNSSWVTTM